MKNALKIFLFSVIVTLVMNALDMSFHYGAGTAVHLNYVAIKLTIIFFSVYLISQSVGISTRDGIVASLFGPFMFWLYYVFAYPTLDREVYWIDEQFYFMFIHITMMFVAYFSSYWLMTKKSPLLKKACFIVSSSLALVAVTLLHFMIDMRLENVPEEESVNMLSFHHDAGPMLLVFLGATAIATFLPVRNLFQSLVAGILAVLGGIIYIVNPHPDHQIADLVILFVSVVLISSLINTYGKTNA